MKFLIVEPSPFHILIPLGPKYSPQDHVFKYLSLHSSLNVRDHVSQPYSTISSEKLRERDRERELWGINKSSKLNPCWGGLVSLSHCLLGGIHVSDD